VLQGGFPVFDVLLLMFSWLPAPLDKLVFGAFCIMVVTALIYLVAAIIDALPFT
jgi:hypothetical protein